MKVVDRVRVPLPPSALWPLVANPQRWPEWMEGVVAVEVEAYDASGAALSWVERFRSPTTGALLGVRQRAVESVQGRKFAWELVPRDSSSLGLRQTIALRASARGTEVSYAVEILNPASALGLPLVNPQSARLGIWNFISSSLGRLTRRLEAEASP